MNKPKKPLRSLFTRTESAPEPKEVISEKAPIETKTTAVAAAPSPKAEPLVTKPASKQSTATAEKAASPKNETAAVAKPAQTAQASSKEKEIVITGASKSDSPMTRRETEIADAVTRVNYNFEASKEERQKWHSDQYINFIRRIDNAQTEAFFLKGKLLDEAKKRYFEDNKVGWKNFCEDKLFMNYTTANQYIRVSQEFDVTSHQRPDFGFEHFKALLPLAPEERASLLENLPAVSVKSLRNMVQERLLKALPTEERDSSSQAKNMVKLLQNLKKEIMQCEADLLPQTQRWQLSAACRNLAEELTLLAHSLNASQLAMQRNAKTTGASAGGDNTL